MRDGAVQWTRVYGQQAEGVPATDSTLYNVASLTKPLFAERVLRLAADGRLSLDEPMAPFWTDLDLASEPRHTTMLTPRLALSHQLGRGHRLPGIPAQRRLMKFRLAPDRYPELDFGHFHR